MASMQLKPVYGLVTLSVTLAVGQYLVYTDTIRQQRLQSFPPQVVALHFTDQHKREIGDEPAAMGWPDDGNGRYTLKLPYADWYFLNVTKRQT